MDFLVRGHLLVGCDLSLIQDILFCLKPRCPVCRQGRLFKPQSISVVDTCDVCKADLSAHDIGDGAAVFLIFILGFSVIPAAWVVDLLFEPALWVHVILWGSVTLGLIILMLPATKAMIILLEHRHRSKKTGV